MLSTLLGREIVAMPEQPEKAELLQSMLGTFAFMEVPQPYPLSAKYHMNLCDIPTNILAISSVVESTLPLGNICGILYLYLLPIKVATR